MAEVNLENITDLNFLNRFRRANGLVAARRTYADTNNHIKVDALSRELPYPADGYSNGLKAFRRLGRIAHSATFHSLSAYIVKESDRVIGVATTQLLKPKPKDFTIERTGGIELSYWHRWVSNDAAKDLGIPVMKKLFEIQYQTPGSSQHETAWMVTLPDDEVKAAVCLEVGMNPHAEPLPYFIEDGVNEPRQLWVANPLT